MKDAEKLRLPRLETVLLIDDDAAINFLHRRVFKKLGCAEHIIEVLNGSEAIAFLTTKNESGHYPQPQMILLDINMNVMNGWDFLRAYDELPASLRMRTVIVMVSTSMNPDDAKRARSSPSVNAFLTKPLTMEALSEIISRYFQSA